MQLQKTSEIMTAGIVSVPLTKPARIFFYCDNQDEVIEVSRLLDIPVEIFTLGEQYIVETIQEQEPSFIKMIWRNFKSYRPKLDSQWRYLFWEVDEQSEELLTDILEVYRYLNLPVYIHKTMRGYHFMSVKPISKEVWKWAINQFRKTNIRYPPITLRIKPNKYIQENIVYFEGFIYSEVEHHDTMDLKRLIENQDFGKIGDKYYLVWYPIDRKPMENEV